MTVVAKKVSGWIFGHCQLHMLTPGPHQEKVNTVTEKNKSAQHTKLKWIKMSCCENIPFTLHYTYSDLQNI